MCVNTRVQFFSCDLIVMPYIRNGFGFPMTFRKLCSVRSPVDLTRIHFFVCDATLRLRINTINTMNCVTFYPIESILFSFKTGHGRSRVTVNQLVIIYFSFYVIII